MKCKRLLLIVLGFITATVGLLAQQPGNTGNVMYYELYSWQANGGWNFRVVVSPSGVNVPVERVFDSKFVIRGVTELKQKISGLPAGASIFWSDRISLNTGEKAKESAKLSYPSAEIMQNIRNYAEARSIKVDVVSDQQKRE